MILLFECQRRRARMNEIAKLRAHKAEFRRRKWLMEKLERLEAIRDAMPRGPERRQLSTQIFMIEMSMNFDVLLRGRS